MMQDPSAEALMHSELSLAFTLTSFTAPCTPSSLQLLPGTHFIAQASCESALGKYAAEKSFSSFGVVNTDQA